MSDPTPRSEASQSKWADPEIRRRIIAGQQRYWKKYRKNPKLQEQRRKAATDALAPKEVRERISKGTKEGLADPEVLQKISENSTRAWDGNTKRRKAASKLAKEILCNPEIVAQARAAHATPETSKAISEGNTKSWAKDPERNQRVGKWATGLWAQRRRLKNVEGLDLKTGLRVSLAACLSLKGATSYAIRNDVYPDSVDPPNAIKKLFANHALIIEAEKQRFAALLEDQRRDEAEDLRIRVKRITLEKSA